MTDSSSRPSLPTSSSAFALPATTSASVPPTATADAPPTLNVDDSGLFLRRLRRSSFLSVKGGVYSETRLQSPLVNVVTDSPPRVSREKRGDMDIGAEDYRDKMRADSSSSSSSSSAVPTPPSAKDTIPSTPPRNESAESLEPPLRLQPRRLSFPPRLLTLLSEEARPEENEVKSEAQFQRLLASVSELPLQPRTPRIASDRGRYPEEAAVDDNQREDTPSDDGYGDESTESSFWHTLNGSEPICITKPSTPANSIHGGDELYMSLSESPGGWGMMDVDTPSSQLGSPLVACPPPSQWRHTPPPTSAVRSNKRKLEDRFDPYPAAKRRAVSPSVSTLRESHSTLVTPVVIPRSPVVSSYPHRASISIPMSMSASSVNTLASSPTLSTSWSFPIASSSTPRPMSVGSRSVTSSPTIRPSVMLSSPVLRPIPRWPVGVRRGEGEEKEVDGAGNGVGSLSIE